jgi:uncharacterized protein YkwD
MDDGNKRSSGVSILYPLFSILCLLSHAVGGLAHEWREASEGLGQLELLTVELVNQERIARGLRPLVIQPGLTEVARGHSQDMAERRYFSHTNPDGYTVAERARLAGVRRARRLGENLGIIKGVGDPVGVSVRGWMQSPPHRQHILNKRYKYTGVGIAQAVDGTLYFTQVFADR